jgi:hypothetical protein
MILFFVVKHEFCCKSKIFFSGHWWLQRLLDVVSCEFKIKCLKKGGPVEAMKFQWNFYLHGTFCPFKKSFTGTGFKPTFLEISFIIQRESNNQIKLWDF